MPNVATCQPSTSASVSQALKGTAWWSAEVHYTLPTYSTSHGVYWENLLDFYTLQIIKSNNTAIATWSCSVSTVPTTLQFILSLYIFYATSMCMNCTWHQYQYVHTGTCLTTAQCSYEYCSHAAQAVIFIFSWRLSLDLWIFSCSQAEIFIF